MATRDIELCNLALIKLKTKVIANFTDDARGISCGLLFSEALRYFGGTKYWTWNEVVTSLEADVEPDPAPTFFDYRFTVPADTEYIRKIYGKTSHIEIDNYDYRKRKIYIDEDEIILRYGCQIEATDIPGYCEDAFTSYLAHRLSPTIDAGQTADKFYSEYLQKMTEAYFVDADQRKSPIDKDKYTPDLR